MKQTYRTMMEQITLSDDARASFAGKLENRTRRERHPLRTALIAACLCVGLAGTALAVGYITENSVSIPSRDPKDVTISAVISGEELSSYRLQAHVSLRSGDTLSAGVKEDLSSGTLPAAWQDLDALENYLGVSLIRNPLLDEAPIVGDLAESLQYGWRVCPELAVDTTARYILSDVSFDGESADSSPDMVRVTSHRVVDNREIYIRAYLMAGAGEIPEAGLPGEVFWPEPRMNNELILNENGEWEWKSESYMSAEWRFTESVYQMANGIEATIVTAESVEKRGEGVREYIGYFVSDGVLYSVRPYAVYDPDADSGQTTDRSMLNVLKQVLDGFE